MHELEMKADAVIIGAGIFGLSAAYYLAKLGRKYGYKKIVLVEKAYSMAAGSSTHAAGLVTGFITSPTGMRLRDASLKFLNEIQKNEIAKPLKQTGSWRIAGDDKQLDVLRHEVSRANGLELRSGPFEVVHPEEIKKRVPWIDIEKVAGGVYLPEDGVFDAYQLTGLVGDTAKKEGVKVCLNTRVTGIETENGQISRIKTDRGDIETKVVINAAGMWGGQIAEEMLGIHVPVVPVNHQYQMIHFSLDVLDEFAKKKGLKFDDFPCIRDFTRYFYFRFSAEGGALGIWEPNPVVCWADKGYKVPREHDSGKRLPDYREHFEPHLLNAAELFPFILEGKGTIGDLISHPDGFAPDSRPLTGPWSDIEGLYFNCAASMWGFGSAPGLGKSLAEQIIHGQSEIDISSLSPCRFDDDYKDPEKAAISSATEYGHYYLYPDPRDDGKQPRDITQSPLHQELKDLGGVFKSKKGWERVTCYAQESQKITDNHKKAGGLTVNTPYFKNIAEECRAVRKNAGIFDLSSFGKIIVEGANALRLLQRVSVSNIDQPIGKIIYTQFCNKNGGIEADITIARIHKNRFWITTGTSCINTDIGWLKSYSHGLGSVKIINATRDHGCIALWGPKAEKILDAVTKNRVTQKVFPFLTAKTIKISGVKVLAQRISYVGEFGYELFMPADKKSALKVWSALIKAGQKYGIRPAGYEALNSLRLEKGMRALGSDMTPKQTPFHVGLGFCVNFDKGNFIGRDALLKIKEAGTAKKLYTVTIGGKDWLPLYGGEAVSIKYEKNEQVLGRLCSAGYGHTVKKNISFAWLPIVMEQGAKLLVDILGEMVPLKIESKVLVK